MTEVNVGPTIPKQLQNPEFRFFLIKKGEKTPMEKLWNTKNCYPFFHSKLNWHISKGGNYGICTGYGNLIILDFDNYEFYKTVRSRLPWTFTTKSASKRAPHYYYYLKDEMFRKIGIDRCMMEIKYGKIHNHTPFCDPKRVCDIQAWHSGIVAPNSKVGRNYYEVYDPDMEISDITIEKLIDIFPYIKDSFKGTKEFQGSTKSDKEAVIIAIEILKHHEVKRASERHFSCPFHTSESGSCLYVQDDGGLYCFHCQRRWPDVHKFVDDLILHKVSVSG